VEGGGWIDRRGRTWVFNAGHQAGSVPSHIVIDLDGQSATWFGIPEEESVSLSAGSGAATPG
jgi:hypothetical protein